MTRIPILDLKAEYLYMKADIDAAIARCLEHQKWIFGPEIKEFEEKVAEYIGVKHCVGTSSGTDALVLALRALAIKTKGQEYFDRSDLIITTPFTFTATGDAILRAGATPLFVDIDPITYNIDPAKIKEALEKSKELGVKVFEAATHHSLPFISDCHDPSPFTPNPSPSSVVGILPVHLYGQPCNMDEIMLIASEYNLFVVEDCAQAFGGGWQMVNDEWQKVGSIGDIGCFSFFPSKNLGGFGDAGMVSTNDDELNELIRMLIKHGGKDKYNVDHIGYNARMDTLQASILLAKLPYIDEFNLRRQHIAEIYIKGLAEVSGVILPVRGEELRVKSIMQSSLTPRVSPITRVHHVFHQFTLRIPANAPSPAAKYQPPNISHQPPALSSRRDSLQNHLRDAGVDSMVYYPVPLHKMAVFFGRCLAYGELKHAETAANEVLSLPIEPLYDDICINKIIEMINAYYNR